MEGQGREPFAQWVILELMGHRRLAGYVREVEIAGQGMLRIDIPSEPPATQFYNVSSVYCMTPTTESIVRAVAQQNRPQPVQQWELPGPEAQDYCEGCGRTATKTDSEGVPLCDKCFDRLAEDVETESAQTDQTQDCADGVL